MTKRKRFYEVKITWRDAASPSTDGWQPAAEGATFIGETCYDFGVVIFKDKDWVVVAGGYSSSGDVHRVFAVPAGCVVKVEELRGTKKGEK